LQSVSQPRKFYTIIALSMMITGSVLLIFSVADIVTPRANCHDNLDFGVDILVSRPAHCIDPFNMVPQYNSFIIIVLAICLLAFGDAIVEMIIRL